MASPSHFSHPIHALDLHFLDLPGTIAAYLILHAEGAVLVECGPGSTVQNLISQLAQYDLKPRDIHDVLLTHIHLDHGGSAGWWARQGAKIHVHPAGAPHLVNPEKLLASASRIYGDQMDRLWGEFLAVPEESIVLHQDQETFQIGNLEFKALDTPGHATHHLAYIFQDVCFSGDIGGVRMTGTRHLRLPMPPPELNLEQWQTSLQKLEQEYQDGKYFRLAPTHFGIFEDAGWHLQAIGAALQEAETWISTIMGAGPSIEEINMAYKGWMEARAENAGLTPQQIHQLEAANPSGMAAAGIHRYWHKVRNPA